VYILAGKVHEVVRVSGSLQRHHLQAGTRQSGNDTGAQDRWAALRGGSLSKERARSKPLPLCIQSIPNL
jgi:hypothetical protein